MRRVFLTGALARPQILTRILGEDAATQAGTLTGYTWAGGKFDVMPGVMRCDGAAVAGRVLNASHAQAAQVGFFYECFGLQLEDVTLDGQTALCALGTTDAPVSAWDDAHLPILGYAAQEIMTYHHRYAAQSITARMHMILARAQARVAAQVSSPADIRSSTPADHVTLLQDDTTHEGFFLTKTINLRHPQFDGTESAEVTREVFVATDAAIVLPYDPVLDRVLLVEQFRMGPYGRGDPLPWVLEPVAGRVDPGEAPELTARRECEEEAGLALQALEHVNSHYCSPGCSTEVFHCYIGLCQLPDITQGQGGLATEHEDIRTHVLDFADALELTRSGEANIGPLVLLLLWLERERPRLRSLA